MTFLSISDTIREMGEGDHFLELMNTCIQPIPTDPKERQEAVYPYLNELADHLDRTIKPTMNRDELKRVVHEWIDEKITLGPSDPGL